MVLILSLLTALTFGAGDFAGGMAAKRTRVVEVVAGSHLVGLTGATIAAVLLAEQFRWPDLFIGMAAGASGAMGIAFLYRRLAAGPMSIVAPITAVTSAVVPVSADLIRGTSLGWISWVGIFLGIAAILIVSSSETSAGAHGIVTARVVAESLLAGIGFGGFFVIVDLTEDASAPWPIVGGRILTGLVLGLYLIRRPAQIRARGRETVVWMAIAGLLDAAANIMFLYAANAGDLAVVSVLTSMYPISTILLAAVVLHERVTRPQLFGVAVALAATALIAAG